MLSNSTKLSFTISQIAELTRTQWVGNPYHVISGVEELTCASPHHISFLENPRYEKKMRASNAGAIFVLPTTSLEEGKNYLISQNPSLSFQTVVELFLKPPQTGFEGIHPSAIIHPTACIGNHVTVGPLAVIEQGVSIGERTTIGSGVFIGAKTTVGEACFFYPRVVIREGCVIGNRVIIQPGAIIGSSGFGYFSDKQGKHHLLQQLGSVILEDDVEIGANTTIDRARFKETRIGKGSKIDNLVQIGHQVTLGEDNLIVAQTGIAGSTSTGKNVTMAGQVGVVGHIEITDFVTLAARSAPIQSIKEPGIYSGAPAAPIREFNEQLVLMRSLRKLAKRVESLERRLPSQEQNLSQNDTKTLL